MDNVANFFNAIPSWIVNLMAVVGFFSSIVTLRNYCPKMFLFKRKAVYSQLMDKLKDNTYKYWSCDKPNKKNGDNLISIFMEVNKFISHNKFKISPSDYRSSLFDIITMDMEDNDIFKYKQSTIKRHYNTLIDELGKYEKYIL